MKAAAYVLEQEYAIGRRRLINRSVLGWGVVRGFALSLRGEKPDSVSQEVGGKGGILTVCAGLALDHHGREIVLEAPVTLGRETTVVLRQGSNGPRWQKAENLAPGRYVLAIHYGERPAGTLTPGDCSCDEPQHDRVCETAVFSLRPIGADDRCPCGEAGCSEDDGCHSSCGCDADERGPHGRLCAWAEGRKDAGAGAHLSDCEGLAIDASAPVDLACVTLVGGAGKCDPLLVASIDEACQPRRIVKTNDLLYDLIRGCDLTRISAISWQAQHRRLDWADPVRWEDFLSLLKPPASAPVKPEKIEKTEKTERQGRTKHGTTGLTVRFTGPVLVSTLLLDAIVISIHTTNNESGWRIGRRVPVDKLIPLDPSGSGNDATALGFVVHVDADWLADEVDSNKSWFNGGTFLCEIEIRGSLIRDCSGQAIDADPRGLNGLISGNGTPGGLFHSSFVVAGRKRPVVGETVNE
ncbi:MAG: hypothetical protein ING01_05500 [Rhodobacter sp.]|nr:hypothetical protein [Rhodobacter sp.]